MSTTTLAPDQDSVNPAPSSPDERSSADAPTHATVTPPAHASADLVRRIAEAMLNAGEVTKSSVNKDQNYKFASAESILAAVRLPLLERSILLTQTPRVYEEHEIKSARGTAGSLLTVAIDFAFRCGMTGEVLVIEGWRGQGQDYGDKAYGKAYTNAVKTFIRAQWLLPTGDDPEGSDSGERMAKNGTAHVVAPAWAAPADTATKAELVAALAKVIGDRDQAKTFAAALAAKCGGFPDTVAKWVISLPEWIGTHAATTPADTARAAQDTAAETPPPEPEPEGPPADYIPSDPPGSVDMPSLAGADEETALARMRQHGCTCLNPFEDTDHNTACPIKGHGIGF